MGRVLRALKSIVPENAAVVQQQQAVEACFSKIVAKTNLHFLPSDQEIMASGTRFLVGVATWSELDWKLLDQLDEALARTHAWVDVFSVGTFSSPADIDKLIPGIGIVYQTPIVGLWQERALQDKAAGASGRRLIEQWFHMKVDVSVHLEP